MPKIQTNKILPIIIITTLVIMTLFVGVLGYAVYNKSKTNNAVNTKPNVAQKTNIASQSNQQSNSINIVKTDSKTSAVSNQLCSLLRINTFEEYEKATFGRYASQKNSTTTPEPIDENKARKEFIKKALSFIKPKITVEDYKLFESYINQQLALSIANKTDTSEYKEVTDKGNKLILKYPGLETELQNFSTGNNLYGDEITVSDSIAEQLIKTTRYDDTESTISNGFTPLLKYNFITYTIASAYGVTDYNKHTFDKLFASREMYFLKNNDLKDLTPQKLFETQLCKIKYDIENSKIANPTDRDLNSYPLKYINKLGRDESLKQINDMLKKINTVANADIYDYQIKFLDKLAPIGSDSDQEYLIKQSKQVYTELQNLYKYKNVITIYTDPELVTQRKKYITDYKSCLDKIGVKYSTINNGEEVDESYTNIKIIDSNNKDQTICKDQVANEFKQMYKDFAIKNLTPSKDLVDKANPLAIISN